MTNQTKNSYYLIPITSGILWGAIGIFVRKLSEAGMDSLTILSVRMSFAAVIMLAVLYLYNKSLLKIKLKDLWLFACCGILGTIGLNYCYNEAIARLPLSLAAVLLSLSPVFVLFWSALLFGERITLKKIGCTVLAVIGCLLVSGILESQGEVSWSFFGVVIGLGAAFFCALYSVFSKFAMAKSYDPFTITFYSLLTAAIVLIPFTDWQTVGRFVSAAPVKGSFFLILHAVCTSVLPYVLYTLALTYVDTGKAAILSAGGEPVAAMIFGLLLFSEQPTLLSVAGLIVTIIALSVLCLPDKKAKAQEAE